MFAFPIRRLPPASQPASQPTLPLAALLS